MRRLASAVVASGLHSRDLERLLALAGVRNCGYRLRTAVIECCRLAHAVLELGLSFLLVCYTLVIVRVLDNKHACMPARSQVVRQRGSQSQNRRFLVDELDCISLFSLCFLQPTASAPTSETASHCLLDH